MRSSNKDGMPRDPELDGWKISPSPPKLNVDPTPLTEMNLT